MKLRLQSVIVLSLFLFSPILWADTMGSMQDFMDQVSKQMAQMQKTIEKQNQTIDRQNEKIKQLENRQPQVQIGAPSGEGAVAPMSDYEFNERLNGAMGGAHKWLKDLKFSGDLRMRYEAFQFTSGNPSESDDRNRFRFRLRYGFEKKFSDEVKVGFAMASGEVAGTGNDSGLQVDPTATNQSFDNLFNFKDIWIEKAYASYSPNWVKVHPVIQSVEILGGKFTNPFEKGSSDLIWDRDVKPEGAAERIDLNLYDSEEVDVKAYGLMGQFVLDEDSSGANYADSELYAWQGGINVVAYTPFFERPVDWTSALSWYKYDDYAQNSNFMIGATSLARGNSNFVGASTELDAQDFSVIELYNEVAFYPHGIPIRPFYDVATNVANVSQQNDEGWAWALGTKIGGIQKKGDWEVSYAYKRIENDSVVGAFNDSDFGLGHSGKRGNQFKLGYAITDYLTLNGAAFFVNNLTTGTASVRDEEQRRFQADLVWKF